VIDFVSHAQAIARSPDFADVKEEGFPPIALDC
jgi:hypothetical protein